MKSKKLLWVFLIGLIIFGYRQVYAENVNKNLDLALNEEGTNSLSGKVDNAGNYISVGYKSVGFSNYSAYIVKYKDKNVLWKKEFTDLSRIMDVDVDDKDNIYVLAIGADSYSDEYSYSDCIVMSKIIKFDKNGNKIFEKKINDNYYESEMERLKVYDGNIYVLGEAHDDLKYLGSANSEHNKYELIASPCLMKYDLDGNFIFDRIFGGSLTNYQYFLKKGEINHGATLGGLSYRFYDFTFKDDKVFVVGYISNYALGGEINAYALISTDGEKIFDKKLNGDGYFRFASVDINNDGEFVVVGFTKGTKLESIDIEKDGKEGGIPVLLVFDNKGELKSSNYLKSLMQFRNVVCTYNGYFILADLDEENIDGLNNSKYDDYLIKFDKDLNIIGYDRVDSYYDLKKIADDKVLVTGYNSIDKKKNGSLKVYESEFNIETEKNDFGEIEVNLESKSGEEVKIKVKPIDGYVLDSIEGVEIKKIDNETYSFIMPSQDIKLIPKFKKSILNPETKDIAIVGISAILVIAFVLICKNYKKIKWLN